MNISIMCSNCGATREMCSHTPRGDMIAAVSLEGWGSCGSALYCPDCSCTWRARNRKPMASRVNTCALILDAFIRAYESGEGVEG